MPVNLGPSERAFWEHCVDSSNPQIKALYVVSLIGAVVLLLVNLVAGGMHRAAIDRKPISRMQLFYLQICRMPLVFGVTAFLSLISPRSMLIWTLLQKQYEAQTLRAFGQLLMSLLAREHGGGEQGRVEDTGRDYKRPLLQPAGQRSSVVASVVAAFEAQGQRKYWATPPVLICCTPCIPKHTFNERYMLWVVFCLHQFVFLVPMCALVSLWATLAFSEDDSSLFGYEGYVQVAKVVCKISSVVALQGLFVLYKSTHDLLHRWNTTMKFVSIKLILLAEILQEPIIERLVEAKDKAGYGQCELTGHHRVMFWDMWWLGLEAVIMAFMLRAAYPARELDISEGHSGNDLEELDLYKHARDRSSGKLSCIDDGNNIA